MKARLALALCATVVAALAAEDALACSTFCLERRGEVVFGKNYDFGIGYGMLVVNKRGVAKTAQVSGGERPAKWTSRFGSVTFNQFGREFPSGGMNEAGLVVELMWLDAAKYPARDARPALTVLEWIQYQLDNSATVAEVAAAAERVRIASRTPLHYLVGDRSGACASIEFLDGRLVAHTGPAMPVKALTNDTYASSLAYLRAREKSGAAAPPPGAGSLERFARAATMLRDAPERDGPAVAEAFRILDGVATPGWTQWSIAYDLVRRRVHFKTRENPRVRSFELARLDFSCRTPARVLDVDADGIAFRDYSREENRALMERSFRGVDFLRATPATELDAAAAYPDSTACVR